MATSENEDVDLGCDAMEEKEKENTGVTGFDRVINRGRV